MDESLFENNSGVVWHTHDIYEGAGGDTRHAHPEGNAAHVHDWSKAVPVTESRDTFIREAERLHGESITPSQEPDQYDNPSPT